LIIGLIFLIGTGKFIELLLYIFAIKVLIESVAKIATIARARKEHSIKSNWISLFESLLLILISIIILLNPLSGSLIVFYGVGIYAFVTGFFHAITLWGEKPKKLQISLYKQYLSNWIISSLSFCIGALISSIITVKLLEIDFDSFLDSASNNSRETLGVVIIVILISIFSLLMSTIGSWLMGFKRIKTKHQLKYNKADLITRMSVGLGLTLTIVGIPSILVVFSIAFISHESLSFTHLATIISIAGALIGAFIAIAIGVKTFTKTQLINSIATLSLILSFSGFIVGGLLWKWIFSTNPNPYLLPLILLPFGLGIGLSIGVILDSPWGNTLKISKKTLASKSLQSFRTSKTIKSRGIFKFMVLVVISVLLFNLFTLLFLSKSSISTEVPLQTVGTHWSQFEKIDQIPEILPTISHEYEINCEDNQLSITKGNMNVKVEDFLLSKYRCNHDLKPLIAQDSKDIVHFIWQSKDHPTFIYESLLINDALTKPSIILTQPNLRQLLIARNGERLQLYWRDTEENAYQMSYTPYSCDKDTLEGLNRIALGASARHHKGEAVIPFCNNKFDSLFYSPNPEKEFSDLPSNEDGAFEYIAQQISEAKHEVLINNMWYSADTNDDNPGTVIAEGISQLYNDLKENPEKYPTGIDVKIMLGNPPEVVFFETESQIWSLLEDLKDAGIDSMYDDEIGWDLQVANYAGSLPHSHVKSVVIDGKTTIATGINLTYGHFPISHTDTPGDDRVDTGIQITGPIAQSTLAVFDDMWRNSNRKHCSDLNPKFEDFWKLSCGDKKGTVSHTPEVLRFYIPEDLNEDTYSNSLSLYRSSQYSEADDVISSTISGSNKTIDTIQVNFSLELICDLNVIIEVCDYNNSLKYMEALMSAVDNNNSKLRILTKKGPVEGIENKVAIEIFKEELKRRGIEDRVEIREFRGDFHSKAIQIDGEFLIIGSQNFHYSAWEESAGLTEYNMTTDNASANEEFNKFFEYHWERSLDLGY
jgi:uncharacterized membrane protein HdeD (DUF308 family)